MALAAATRFGPYEVVYSQGASSAVAVDVRTRPTVGFGRPRILPGAGLPANVSTTSLLNHDVAPGGRFVTVAEAAAGDADSDRIVIVQNWSEELKRLVPTN